MISFSADNYEDGNVPTTLTDALGNNFSVGAGAIFEDGALLNRGAVLDFTEAQGTKLNGKSYTYEFVFGYEDTVAAAAGGLAGALYGYDAIPKEWLDTLKRRDYIEEMCERAGAAWMKSKYEPTHKIVDLHMHVVPGYDDGAETMEEALVDDERLRIVAAAECFG